METATKFTLLAMGHQVLRRKKTLFSIAHMKRNNFLCAAETHRSERNVARWLPCRKVSRNLKYHTRTRELESTDTDTKSDLSNPTQQHQFRNRVVRLKLQLRNPFHRFMRFVTQRAQTSFTFRWENKS